MNIIDEIVDKIKHSLPDKKQTYLCEHFSREMTILSDGRITTCCVDESAKNAFANIYDDTIEDVVKKHLQFKKDYLGSSSINNLCQSLCLQNPEERPYMYSSNIESEINSFKNTPFLPHQFVLELTSNCNAVCKTCIHNRLDNDLSSVRTDRDGPNMNLDYVFEWLKPLGDHLKLLRLYNYGEPFLNKDIDSFAKNMTEACSNLRIDVSTNGTAFGSDERIERIIKSGISHIIVSLHGGTEEICNKYMGQRFPFNKAISNIKRFMEIKRELGYEKPILNMKCVLFKWNDSDENMSLFRNLVSELDADCYHFIPTGGIDGTTRFPPGSTAWKELVDSGLANNGTQENGQLL